MKKQQALDCEFFNETAKVRCEVCGRKFEQITFTHLKKHDITIHEYREQFPDAIMVSEATRQKISEMLAGENNPNYGKRCEETSMYGKHLSKERKQHISEAVSGEKHGMYGKHQTEVAKQKISKTRKAFYATEEGQKWLDEHIRGENGTAYGKGYLFAGEKNGNWKGGRNEARKRREEKRRGFGFIPLNDKFPGTEAHHLDKELVLYIPKELHQSVWHNMFTGQGMEEMNNLACEYVYGIEIDGECFKAKRVEK